MNVLIVGQNTKIANVFGFFADGVYMVIDSSIPNYRSYSENARFRIISSSTNTRSAACILRRAIEIVGWIRRYGINVIFSNEKYSMLAAKIATLLILRGKPILLSTSHNSYAWNDDDKIKKFAKAIHWSTDGYVALATFVSKKLHEHGIPPRQILLLPNTLEDGLFLRKNVFKAGQPLKIAYAAVVNEKKGHHILIEALHLLKKKGLDVRADFYGEVTDEAFIDKIRFSEYSEALKYVDFKGKISNMELRGILKNYDAYVSPTLMEMSPFNILEAQQAGLPIIATNVGGIPDLITDGVSGILVEPGSPKAIADALESLMENYGMAEQYAKNGWLQAEMHSPEKSARILQEFINSIA